MRITRLRLANWRNFRNVDLQLSERALLFGPNASGKSNLLDAIRFLRDLAIPSGGLQFAVSDRGGVSRLRFLNARHNNKARVMIAVELGDEVDRSTWTYELHFTRERTSGLPVVVSEIVRHRDEEVYRNEEAELEDPALRSQTAMEQVSLNGKFRDVATFLAGVEYLHLVPQIVRRPGRPDPSVHHDPFGATFLLEVGQCPKKDYERRRRIMEVALKLAVPQFESIDRFRDDTGLWHLRAKYKNFRPAASAQDERDFSDGTLRLIGLLWTLSDRAEPRAPILLEEPELSLHAEIVKVLPGLISRASESSGRQVLASSHGTAMLEDPGLGPNEVVLLIPQAEGTIARLAGSDQMVRTLVESGNFSVGEAVRADLVLPEIEQLMSLKMS